MKSPIHAVALLFALAFATPAKAQQTYTWNGGVAGTWLNGGGGWLDGAGAANWSNSTSLTASFTGTGPTGITLDLTGITAYGLNFSADGYVLSGGTLTLADASTVGGIAGIIDVGSGFNATINSIVAGSVGLTKAGSGTLVLTQANGYTGTTTVNAGTLTLGATATLGVGNNLSVNNGAILNLGGTMQTIGITNSAGAGGAVGTITNGTLQLNGNNFYFRSGTLDANLTGSGESRLWLGGDTAATILLGGNNTIDYSDHHSTIIGHPITGAVGVVQLTSPTALGPDNIGGNTIEAQLFTGTIDFNGQVGVTVGSLVLANGGNSKLLNTNAATTATSTGMTRVDQNGTEIGGAGSLTVSGVVHGSGGLNKTGAGTLTLSSSNTYGGITIFSGGIVNVSTLADYGSNSSLGNRGGDTGGEDMGLLFRGGTLQYTGSTPQSTNRVIRVSTSGGGGTIDASGSDPSATLTFTAATTPNFWENGGNRTLTFTGTNTGPNTFATAIPDIPGVTNSSITKAGVGTWFLTSTSSNYRGITTLAGGILNVASLSNYDADGSLGNRPSGVDGGDNMGILFRGGTLQYTGSTPQSTNRVIRVSTTGGGGTIDASGSDPSATLSFTAATTPNFWENPGNRTLTLTGTNTGQNTFATAIPDIPGVTTSSVTKAGPGTWNLTSTSSNYRGVTTIEGGILNVASVSNYDSDSSLGNRPSGVDGGQNVGILFRGGVLQYTGSTPQSTNRAIRVSTQGGGGTIDASGSDPAATLSFTAATTPDFWENAGNRTLTLTGTNVGLNTFATIIPDIPGVTTSEITKAGTGTWVLSGANTYRGTTTITDGILVITNSVALGIGGFDGVTLTNVRNGGTLQIQGSLTIDEHFHFAGAGVGGIGAVQVISGSSIFSTSSALDDNGTQEVVFNTNSGASLTLGAVIYNDTGVTAGLTKIGAGTLILSAVNTYGGASRVNGGVLSVNGATAGGTMTVNSGGTLRGTGTIGGAVTVDGGTLRGGNTIGTLSLASGLTIVNGGRIAVQLGNTPIPAAANSGASTDLANLPNPTNNSFLDILGGSTTINSDTNITVDGTGLTFVPAAYSYQIARGAGDQSALNITNAAQFTLIGIDVDPLSVSLTGNAGGAIFLNFSTIPEPAFGLFAIVILARRFTHRRR